MTNIFVAKVTNSIPETQNIKTGLKYKASRYCPNCHFPLPYKAKFCTRCGQKNDDGRVSLKALFKLVWFRVLHLESRSLRFMWLLFIPGHVTKAFFDGHRKRYPQPIRFFFIIMFLFLFSISYKIKSSGMEFNTSYNGVLLQDKAEPDKPKINFYELGKRYVDYEKLRREIDSLPEEYRTPVVKKAVDSLLRRSYDRDIRLFNEIWRLAGEKDTTQTYSADSVPMTIGTRVVRVATPDIFRYDAEGIAEKYQITSWFEQVLLRQGLKTMKDPDALWKAYLGSLAWTLLALVGLMAAVLTLFYRRQGRYYVEHFIFLLNEHTAAFLLISISLWLGLVFTLGKLWIVLAVWVAAVSPLLAMRKFYGQRWGITIVKWLGFSLCYLIGFLLLFFVGMMVVFMFF